MKLSEINIKELVVNQTREAINELDYKDLRSLLLERKPLDLVLNEVNALLIEQYKAEHETNTQALTQKACEAQIAFDNKEVTTDAQEEINDKALESRLKAQLPILETLVTTLNREYAAQEHTVNQNDLTIKQLHSDLQQVHNRIYQIGNERQAITVHNQRRHQHTTSHQYPATHQHPNQHIHTSQMFIYSPQDNLILNTLAINEQIAIAERVRLKSLIAFKTDERDNQKSTLNNLYAEKKEAQNNLDNARSQLSNSLPTRATARQMKQLGRVVRENARLSVDTNLQQLSESSRTSLNQQMQNMQKTLDGSLHSLKHAATVMSYNVYLMELTDAFEKDEPLNMTFHEKEALKSTLKILQNCSDLIVKEQKLIETINKEVRKLGSLKNDRSSKESESANYTKLNQKRVSQTEALSAENKKLESANVVLKGQKQGLLNALIPTSIFGAIAIVPAVIFNPLFLLVFVPALIVGIMSLVKHFQQLSNEKRITSNTKKIADNEAAIGKQGLKASELKNTIIPKLTQQISQQENTNAGLNKELDSLQTSREQLMAKAYNVTPAQFMSQTMFGKTPQEALPPYTPAPGYDEPHGDRPPAYAP